MPVSLASDLVAFIDCVPATSVPSRLPVTIGGDAGYSHTRCFRKIYILILCVCENLDKFPLEIEASPGQRWCYVAATLI